MESIIVTTQSELRNLLREELKNFITENRAVQPAPKYLTRIEMAKELNISIVSLHNHTKAGLISCKRFGGRVLYDPAEVRAAIDKVNGRVSLK